MLLRETEVVTIGDISADLKGKELETLYNQDIRNAVSAAYATDAPTKRQFALLFQELLAHDSTEVFSDTEKAFKPISDWIEAEFKE